MKGPASIGLIKPCCIGDAVMAFPVIDNLTRAYPDARIDVWCGTHTRAVFECHPAVSGIVEIPSIPTLRDVPRLVSTFRSASADGFFVLDRSRLLDAACRVARLPMLGSVRRTTTHQAHETDRYLDTFAQAGIDVETTAPSLDLAQRQTGKVRDLVRSLHGDFVTLHPGGAQNPGAAMLSKRWPPERWRAVIDWLDSRSIGCVLTGSPDERDLCRVIAHDTNARIAAGELTLIESAAVAASGLAYAGPDTGLSHLVAATGTPTIAIFGPTNPRQYAPRGEHVTILAPPDSYSITDADLRKPANSERPSTGDVAVESVIDALQHYIECNVQASPG